MHPTGTQQFAHDSGDQLSSNHVTGTLAKADNDPAGVGRLMHHPNKGAATRRSAKIRDKVTFADEVIHVCSHFI